MLEGKNGELPARVCDVRDVARAHIRAMEDSSITGRIIVSQPNNIPSSDILTILRKRFPQYKLQEGAKGGNEHIIDNSKVRHHTNRFLAVSPGAADSIMSHLTSLHEITA